MIKQILAPRRRKHRMNRRVKPFLLQRTVEMQLHVAGAFEFFENQLVHSAAGFGQRGGKNSEAAAFFDIAGGSKKFLGLSQRLGFDAARHGPSLARLQTVIATRETGEAVE